MSTTLTIEDIENIRTISIGDVYTQDSLLNSYLRAGGIQIGTNFALRPDIITYPLPDFAGKVAVPSSVDIFLENSKIYSKDLKPGPFEIKEIPVLQPEGTLKVVITDALGRQQIVKIPYITSRKLLRRDLIEYSLTLGLLRKNYYLKDFDYTKPIFSGFFRKGMTNYFTLGFSGYIQSQDGFNLGSTGDILLGKMGLLSPMLAFSYDNTKSATGFQYGFEYSKSLKFLNVRLKSLYSTDDFFQQKTVIGRLKNSNSIFLGFRLGKIGNLSLSYVSRDYINSYSQENYNISYSRRLFGIATLSLAMNVYKGEQSNTSFRGGLYFPLGNRFSGKFNISKNENDTRYTTEISKRSKYDLGIWYSLRVDKSNDFTTYTGNANYNTEFVTLYSNLYYSSTSNDISYRLGTKGTLIYIDGNFFIKRAILSSFGIVKIYPPIEGAEVKVNEKVIGKTNKNGELFIPYLSPFVKNEIKINPATLDVKTHIENNIYSFVPLNKHGYILKFKAKKLNSVRLKIKIPEDVYIPAGLRFYVDGKKTGILGFKGKAYIENISEGKHLVEIDYGGSKCQFEINITRDLLEKVIPYIGEYNCKINSNIVKEKHSHIKIVKKHKTKKTETKKKVVKKSNTHKLINNTLHKKTSKIENKPKNYEVISIDIENYDEYREYLEFRENLMEEW